MKILALADLHINEENSTTFKCVKNIVDEVKPDAIVIAGDVFESDILFNPYKELSKLETTVICCLGNHEFAYRSVYRTKEIYKSLYDPDLYDVHYLDIIGHKKINNVNFVGNVLWYDGSQRNYPGQGNEISPHWLDSSIIDFSWNLENKNCVKQIMNNYDSSCKNVLITHCVPNKELNLFLKGKPTMPNMYSGMNLLDDLHNDNSEIHFEWVICGHTHRYVFENIYGQNCVNIGNDYFVHGDKIEHFIFEV